jgi:hypothetical protein
VESYCFRHRNKSKCNKVTDQAKGQGDVIIFKQNKSSLVLFDVETLGEEFMKENELLKPKHLSDDILREYRNAFQELLK